MDVRFKVPSNFYISGQSQCGKSYLVRRLLYHLNELFHPVPSKVIYCYGEYQKEFDQLRGVEFIEGFPQDLKRINPRTRPDVAHTRRFNERMFKRSTRFRFVYTGFTS